MLNYQSRTIFSVLLVVSILLHAIVWWWVDIKDLFKPDPSAKTTTVQITLQPPKALPVPPKPKPPVPKQAKKEENVKKEEKEIKERHLPIHNADTFASSNTTDSTIKKIKNDKQVGVDKQDQLGDKHKNKKKKALEADKTTVANKKATVTTDKTASKPLKNSDKDPGEDNQNSEQKRKQVYSENASDELKMQNLYLARMKKQVTEKLVKPRRPVRPGRGAISIYLGSDGYLKDAKITKSSGDFSLDLSVLEAIKRVHRFEVPPSKEIAGKYYTQLVFYYSEKILEQ